MEARSVRARIERARRSARTDRLRARAPRWIGIAFLVVMCLAGVRQVLFPTTAAPPPPPAEASADPEAESLAQQFTRAYLSYDADRPERRERDLRPYLRDHIDPDGGLIAERGSQRVLWTYVAQSKPGGEGERTVVVAAGVSTQRAPLYVAVGVERDGSGALRLSGYPALVGPPLVSGRERSDDLEEVEDPRIEAMAKRVVANYISGQERNLRADLAPSAQISPPTTELRMDTFEELQWAGGERSDAVVAQVQALDRRRNTYALAYEIGLERRRGRFYATYVQTVPTK